MSGTTAARPPVPNVNGAAREPSGVNKLDVHELTFADGRRARVVAPPPETAPEVVLTALGLEDPQAVIVSAGGAGGLDAAA